MKIRFLKLLTILLVAAACSGTPATTPATPPVLPPANEPASSPGEAPALTEAAPPLETGQTEPAQTVAATGPAAAPQANPLEEEVLIPAAEGLEVAGAFRTGDAASQRPGVLLLHMVGGRRGDWNPLAEALAEGGYAVLAVDLRGHGDTGGGTDWAEAPEDIPLLLDYLVNRPEVDPERIAIVGASIGANLALVTAAGEPTVGAIVLLSPGLDYYGIQTEEAMASYGERPALILAAESDAYAFDSSQKLAETGAGAELQAYPGPMHGTQLLYDTTLQPEAVPLILEWLNEHVA